MKSLFIVLLAILFCASAGYSATAAIAGDGVINMPGNVKAVKLGNCNSSSTDTIKTGNAIVYGPYNLSMGMSRPMFASLKLRASKACFSSGDSIQFGYQIIPSGKISDTIVSGWTATDTIIGVNGKIGATTDISTLNGVSIVFRLLSIDGGTAIVQTPIRVILRESMTASPDTK
jgi:type 1 fimbria pilin